MMKQKAFRPRAQLRGSKDWFNTTLLLFALFFVGLTVPTAVFFVNWTSALSVVFFVGFELIFIGIAYDLTESIFALGLMARDLPMQSTLTEFPPVALVITLCDDVIPEVLEQLRHQNYPNYDIFVLDDSQDPSQQAIVDRFSYLVLRRGTRRAYKAGNLNNWLDKYGSRYKYFAILDSDSYLPENFITQMVSYAEHPQNKDVAVFQSKILPRNPATKFARILASMAPLRLYVLERFANNTGLILSWGHNNLNRADSILQVGGFNEYVTAEDTTLSLMLSTQGYCVKLVNIWSYDTEPADAFSYTNRTMRWAKQTVEVFRLPWRQAAFRLKLLLCFHLYCYLMPVVYFGLLLLIAWAFRANDWPLGDLVALAETRELYFISWFWSLVIMTGVWGLQLLLRLVLARRAGLSWVSYFCHAFWATTLTYFAAISVSLEMLKAALGSKTHFTPTNVRERKAVTLQAILTQMWPSITFAGLVLAGVVVRNRYLIFSLNSLWLFLWLIAPLTLWRISREGKANEL